MVQCLVNLVLFQKYFEFFSLNEKDVEKKVILVGSFNDFLTWTPSQHQIKLMQQLPWVNKDLVQFQNQFPILMRQQYSILWVMQWAKAVKMVRSQGNQEFQKPFYWMMVRVQALLSCFPCTELTLSQLHATTPLRNAVNVSSFLYLKVRPGELFSIPQKLFAQWGIQAWGIEVNIKLNFILISDQQQQFHIWLGSPKLTFYFLWCSNSRGKIQDIFFDHNWRKRGTECKHPWK